MAHSWVAGPQRTTRILVPGEFAARHHVIEMGEHFGKGKRQFVRIERPLKQNRDQIIGRMRSTFAGLRDQGAAFLVMERQIRTALMQAVKRQPVPGQNEHVGCYFCP